MLDAAMDAETARLRLAKRAFDSVDASEALDGSAKAAKGGGKLSRSETVTVRLDPKLRYLAELAARMHRRTLSSYIEWAIEGSLDNNLIRPDPSDPRGGPTIKDEAEYLWDVDEADRFAKLALRYPHLLTHEEQVRWKLIRENGFLWKGAYRGTAKREWTWTVDEASLVVTRLREHWAAFCQVADAGVGHSELLPTWNKTEPAVPVPVVTQRSTGFDDMDGYTTPPAAPRRAAPPPRSPPPSRVPHQPPGPPIKTGFDDMDDDIPF